MTKTKKIFISQPMRGKSIEQIKEEREVAINTLKAHYESIEILESVFDDFNEGTHPLKFLSRAIDTLADADIAVFMDGWRDARGCKIEHECAINYSIPVWYM